jgi:hypothetical protein
VTPDTHYKTPSCKHQRWTIERACPQLPTSFCNSPSRRSWTQCWPIQQ